MVGKKTLYYFDTAGDMDEILFDEQFKFLGIATARNKQAEVLKRIQDGK